MTDFAQIISEITLTGALVIAVIYLWRSNIRFSNLSRDDREAAQKAAEDAQQKLISSHEDTKCLLMEQIAMFKHELSEERILRETEWKEHRDKLEEITKGYQMSLMQFNKSMAEVQIALQEQTRILQKVQNFISENTIKCKGES